MIRPAERIEQLQDVVLDRGQRPPSGRRTRPRARPGSSRTPPTSRTSGSCERRGPGPPEHGPDAGEQLLGAERLGQVVVGPGVEPGDPVDLRGPGREHDHRDLALAADQAEQLEAVEAGHHHVEQDQVVPAAERPGQPPSAVVDRLQADAPAGEELLHQLAELDVVVDQQDRESRRARARPESVRLASSAQASRVITDRSAIVNRARPGP